jgi:hypothetical protein
MSTIDVSAEIDIEAAPADLAGVMFDPQREPEWIVVISAVELIVPALAPGARVRRTASLFGQTLVWTSAVERVHFPHLLTLQVEDGPFTGTTRYDIQRSGTGSRVRVRHAGDLGQWPVPAAAVAAPLKAAMAADLAHLKAIVEGRGEGGPQG